MILDDGFLSNEKFFYLDRVYNSQNDQVRVANRDEVDEKGSLHEKTKFHRN